MKTTRVLSILTLGLALLFSGGCGKNKSAPAPEGFKTPVVESAMPNSFNHVAAYLDPGGTLYLYLSTEQWLKELSKNVGQLKDAFGGIPMPEAEREKMGKVFDMLAHLVQHSGVEEISGVGLSSIATEKDFYRTKSVLHHYKGSTTGFGWTMFGKSAHALNGIDMAPATTAMEFFGDFDAAQFWSVLQDETKQLGVPELDRSLADWPAEFKRNTQLDWNKMLSSLGGEFGFILTLDESRMVPLPVPSDPPLEIPEPGLLIVAKAQDDTLFNYIEQRLASTGMELTRIDKGSLKMRTLNLPLPVPFLRPSFAIADGYLFIASSDTLIEEVLAVKSGAKPGLKSTEEFKRLFKDLPTQGNCYGYASKRFGETYMKIWSQILEMQAQQGGAPNIFKSFMDPNNVKYSSFVAANTDEGWVSVGNGNQNGAIVMAAVPVAVVGMLAAIAIPNFVKARTTAQHNACINNLRQIDGAKQQWALENRKKETDLPTDTEIAPYMRGGMPVCPQGGEYTIGTVGTEPSCTIPGHSLHGW